MLLHFVIPFNLIIMQHDHVLKKLNFDLMPRVREGSAVKIFTSMLLHFVIP